MLYTTLYYSSRILNKLGLLFRLLVLAFLAMHILAFIGRNAAYSIIQYLRFIHAGTLIDGNSKNQLDRSYSIHLAG
jgi:hypothetical protein